MLTAKSNYNHYTQTMQFSRSALSQAPPPATARIDTIFHVLDAFFEFQEPTFSYPLSSLIRAPL